MNDEVRAYLRSCSVGVPIALVLGYAACFGLATVLALPDWFPAAVTFLAGVFCTVAVAGGVARRVRSRGDSGSLEGGPSPRLIVVTSTLSVAVLIVLASLCFSMGLTEPGGLLLGASALLAMVSIPLLIASRRHHR